MIGLLREAAAEYSSVYKYRISKVLFRLGFFLTLARNVIILT